MTIFALRSSSYANGVSALHGTVSRRMWRPTWGELLDDEAPIHHVTNGAHTTTWVSDAIAELYDACLGPVWRDEPHRRETWERLDCVPSVELWSAHQTARQQLVGFARRRLARQLEARRASVVDIRSAAEVLDPGALTLGFARRVATYKRLRLLFQDPDRLRALLMDSDRPVQILIGGKAHPDDDPAKEVIGSVVEFAADPDVRRHIVFLEDYDIHLASLLVSGADVWLNTPLRPHEASGTSGMKAAANGVLNLSVLDGWWDEAYRGALEAGRPEVGWALGDHGTDDLPDEEADRTDADVLYSLLERDVIPLFYDRDIDDVPLGWVRAMKAAICELAPRYNAHRMVLEYVEHAYLPASVRRRSLEGESWSGARELGIWKERVASAWSAVKIRHVDVRSGDVVVAGGDGRRER